MIADRSVRYLQVTVSKESEDELKVITAGAKIRFDHDGRLTEAGRRLHEYAQRILALHREARAEVTGRRDPLTGELTLAASSVPGEHLLPALLSAFRQKHPHVQVRATVSDSQTALAEVEAGELQGHLQAILDVGQLVDVAQVAGVDQALGQRVDFERGNALHGSKLLATALSFTRWAEERAKKDMERKPGYQDRDMPRALAGQKQFARTFDRTLDRAGFRLKLVRALALT